MSFQNNIVVETFLHGGPIMWPILVTAVAAVTVVTERTIWLVVEKSRRRPHLVDDVLSKIEAGKLEDATKIARTSKDPFLRVIWHGLHHYHTSLESALRRAATSELERSERFLSAMDTIVTLAPLLGLLGTVTGIMHSFSFVGNEDLAATKVSGGIAEALIATAAGLGIAIVTLLPLNFFSRRVETFRTELENVATDVELLVKKSSASSNTVLV